MEYIFRGGNELVKLKIDRINKKFEIATSKTNYRFIPKPYSSLFDNQEEQATMELIDNSKFEEFLVFSFKKQGYKLVKKG